MWSSVRIGNTQLNHNISDSSALGHHLVTFPGSEHLPDLPVTLLEVSFLDHPSKSLVAQWWRIHLPVQETWVQFLVQEDPRGCEATKAGHLNDWSLCSIARDAATWEAVLRSWRASPALCSLEQSPSSSENPELQPKRPHAAKSKRSELLNHACLKHCYLDFLIMKVTSVPFRNKNDKRQKLRSRNWNSSTITPSKEAVSIFLSL